MKPLGPAVLAFLGPRTYLHSTEVFRFFCETVATLPVDERPVHLLSFKFLRETERNGRAYLLDASEALPTELARPAATLTFRDAQSRVRRLELIDDGEPITARRAEPPSPCQAPILAGAFSGTVACRRPGSVSDLFYALVDANKAVHVETLRRRGENPARAYRFVYCEEFPLGAINRGNDDVVFRFRHRGARLAEGRTYTLNTVQVEGQGIDGIRICFAY